MAENERSYGFVALQSRGTVAVPAELRRRYKLDRPGTQIQFVERDGVIELRPFSAHPAEQDFFWSSDWQAGEREVDELVSSGQSTVHRDAEAFTAHLEALDES